MACVYGACCKCDCGKVIRHTIRNAQNPIFRIEEGKRDNEGNVKRQREKDGKTETANKKKSRMQRIYYVYFVTIGIVNVANAHQWNIQEKIRLVRRDIPDSRWHKNWIKIYVRRAFLLYLCLRHCRIETMRFASTLALSPLRSRRVSLLIRKKRSLLLLVNVIHTFCIYIFFFTFYSSCLRLCAFFYLLYRSFECRHFLLVSSAIFFWLVSQWFDLINQQNDPV